MASEQAVEDEGLVGRTLAGDPRAFERLVEKHYGLVYATALARLGNLEAAEDLAQEVFLRCFMHLGDLRSPQQFGPWLSRVARNLAAEWQRRDQTRSRLVPLVCTNPEVAIAKVPDHREGVREIMDRRMEQSALESALQRLSLQQREIVLLHYMEGLTKREIAERLGVHPSTVGRHIDRALVELRGNLEPVLESGFHSWRSSPRSVGTALSVVGAAASLGASARAEVVAAVAWQQGVAAVTASSRSLPVSGLLSKLSTFHIAGGLVSMGTAKIVTVSVAVVAAAAGIIYVARPSPTPTPSNRPASVGSPAGISATSRVSPLPSLPPGYRLEASEASGPTRTLNISGNPFELVGCDLGEALMFGWQASPGRIQSSMDLKKTRRTVRLWKPTNAPGAEFLGVLQIAIQRAYGVRVHRETRRTACLVVRVPNGPPAAFRPNSDPRGATEMKTIKGRTTLVRGTVHMLIQLMEESAGKPVIDETGMKGRYDFEWSGDPVKAAEAQLGLTVSEEKRDVEIIIVEPDPGA